MRIAAITAGAAGMFCGSCLHDNTLAAALVKLGHDALLIPTFTPIRTDEDDVSSARVFLGGINVYLDQFAAFRAIPRFARNWLDHPAVLRWIERFGGAADYGKLGDLTLSMLRGEHGHQRREFDRLVDWLARDVKPEIVTLTNVLLSGLIPEIRRRLGVPVVAYLQGDDVFLDALPPTHREQAIWLIRENCATAAGFIATSRYYADYMAGYLGVDRERIEVVHPGLNLRGHGGPRQFKTDPPSTIGYFARVAPEKGLHVLVEAFLHLRRRAEGQPCRLRVSGWLGGPHRAYFADLRHRLDKAGLLSDFEYVESPDLVSKVRFLQGCDVLSVPTTFREPKGLYILEALANGTPVVQPAHGSFPELIEATGGGLLVPPNDAEALAEGLHRLLTDAALRRRLGETGRSAVHSRFSADLMARDTVEVYKRFVGASHSL
jgi:glycosyltransferase involved in cell wall biosynthesis